jgi:hypothetical protein
MNRYIERMKDETDIQDIFVYHEGRSASLGIGAYPDLTNRAILSK